MLSCMLMWLNDYKSPIQSLQFCLVCGPGLACGKVAVILPTLDGLQWQSALVSPLGHYTNMCTYLWCL